MQLLESAVWAVIFVIALGIIGSLWQGSTRKQSLLGEWTQGLFWMLVVAPAFLYLSNRLLGWQVTTPTLLITFIIFLVGGWIVSKNLRIR